MMAFTALVVVALVVVGIGIRYNMGLRLTEQFQRRVQALALNIEAELRSESEGIGLTLRALVAEMQEDNRFRQASIQGASSDRQYLLDFAGNAMRLSGLSMLQIQDDSGRIISSGHFRNEYDRREPELLSAMRDSLNGMALVSARTASAPFVALARHDVARIGDRWFSLIGGHSVERQFLNGLAGDQELAVSLVYTDGVASSQAELEVRLSRAMSLLEEEGRVETDIDFGTVFSDQIVTEISLPYVMPRGRERISTATILVTHPLTQLEELRRSIDIWFIAAIVVTAAAALAVATWLSSWLSRPLAELAGKTSIVDLDRLDVGFDRSLKGEVGALSRLLAAMTDRLRDSVTRLRHVERRATTGEIARQVNHDIKNGLIPIRNVLHHLQQLAEEDQNQVVAVLRERQTTLNSSIGYLENLAANYARLYPEVKRQSCDLNSVIGQVGQNVKSEGQIQVRSDLAERLQRVMRDPVFLRRIFENLLGNAIEAVGAGPGDVTILTRSSKDSSGRPVVQTVIGDTGPGMSEEQLEMAFQDFYTTRPGGTGLGLSVVRRLVLDMAGTLKVESEPGVGTRFTIEFPALTSQENHEGLASDSG
jgi:signal transduction histidine kinase